MTKTACFPDILYVFFKNQICLIRSDMPGSTRDVHINILWPSDAIWCHNTWSSSIEVITLHQPLLEPNITEICYIHLRAISQEMPNVTLRGMCFETAAAPIKAPRHWPLCGEFTGDQWIPCTNDQ